MNEQNLKIFMKSYKDFTTKLSEKVNNTDDSLFTQNSENCYLIEESWINDYINLFNQFNKDNSSFKTNITFQKNKPIFINDFKSLISYLKSNKKLKIINKKLLELLYSENELINSSIINYYGGNDKIIIEYQDKKEDKAILFINPLTQNSIINRVFILSINIQQKLSLYKDLLSEQNISNILSNQNYQKLVISFEQYLNKINNSNNITLQAKINQNLNNKNESFKKEIIKILIYIFFYKKYLIEEKEKLFSQDIYYYIINPEWFIKYLEYYDYQNLNHCLINTSKQHPKINHCNIKKYINSIVNIYLKKNLINFEKEKFKDLSDIQKIFAKTKRINNNLSINNCYIIPSDIINLIKTIEFPKNKIQNYMKKIYVISKNIYYMDINKIILGMLHKDTFIPQYILFYNESKILESEKDVISSNPIEDYVKMRNCDFNNKKRQNLISKNIKIGELISLDNAFIDRNSSVNNFRIIPSSVIPKKNKQKYSINTLNKIDNNNLKKKIIFKKPKCITPKKPPSYNNSNDIVFTNPNENKISSKLINDRNQNGSNAKIIENKNNLITVSEQMNLGKVFKNIDEKENNKKEISIDKDKELKMLIENNSLKNKNMEFEELKNEVNKLKKIITEKDNQIQNLKSENNKQNEEKNKLLEQKESIINNLNKKYINIENELKNKEFEINNKIKIIYEIKEKNKENNKEIAFLKQKAFDLESLIEEQKNKYELKLAEIMNKNKNCERLNNELINIIKKKELEEKNKELKKQYYSFAEKEKRIQKKIKDLDIRKSFLEKETELIQKEKKQIKIDIEKNIKSNNIIDEELTKSNEKNNLTGLKGLNRIGDTKYMNATLQCLNQTIDLTSYFLNEKVKMKINNEHNFQLSTAYLEIIEKLSEKNSTTSYNPNNFKNLIEKIYPKSNYEKLEFSKVFILFILENLHNELKIYKNNINNIGINPPINDYIRLNSFNYFIKEYQKESSIISQLFYGILETNSVCKNCKKISNLQGFNPKVTYNYQSFNCILFNLDEVKKSNLYFNNFQIEENKIISLNDCFNHYQLPETVKKDTKYLCNICKEESDILFTSTIYSSPNVLILIILREENFLSNIELNFTETLDITNFVLENKGKLIYNLYGVISQIIENNNNPYYIASCKSSKDQKWYRFYDDKISSITNVNKEVISYGKPCILFYKKIKETN